MRMSTSCEEEVLAWMAAREVYDAPFVFVVGVDLVIVFARSFSTVVLVKNGDVNPYVTRVNVLTCALA